MRSMTLRMPLLALSAGARLEPSLCFSPFPTASFINQKFAIMNGAKGGVEAMSVEKGAKGFQVDGPS